MSLTTAATTARKIEPELYLFNNRCNGVVLQSLVNDIAFQSAAIGQCADAEATPLLGERGQHIPGLLLAAEPPSRAHGSGGIGSQHRGELGVLAALGKAHEPAPG
ncbi:MAG TPA: hypothetical protein VGY66_02710 [Gemmataceae bacterium]|jgi:hypothetical protein|nr:hypothetical protein [Gemmataceae bacterium]